jgi:hypothetical protein
MLCALKPPLAIRQLTDEERAALAAGLRSHDAFSVRRCQSVFASAAGQKPTAIATALHGAPQTGRNVSHASDERGRACMPRGSNGPISVEPVLHAEKREHGRARLHQSPRHVGTPARVWTRKSLAAVWHAQGLSPTTLSVPTMLEASVRVDVNWNRAKPWMVRPDPAYALQKSTAIG